MTVWVLLPGEQGIRADWEARKILKRRQVAFSKALSIESRATAEARNAAGLRAALAG